MITIIPYTLYCIVIPMAFYIMIRSCDLLQPYIAAHPMSPYQVSVTSATAGSTPPWGSYIMTPNVSLFVCLSVMCLYVCLSVQSVDL